MQSVNVSIATSSWHSVVCLCVVSQPWNLQKRLNRSRYRLAQVQWTTIRWMYYGRVITRRYCIETAALIKLILAYCLPSAYPPLSLKRNSGISKSKGTSRWNFSPNCRVRKRRWRRLMYVLSTVDRRQSLVYHRVQLCVCAEAWWAWCSASRGSLGGSWDSLNFGHPWQNSFNFIRRPTVDL